VIGGQPVVDGCVFENNTAGGRGGAAFWTGAGGGTLRRSVLRINVAGLEGGAIGSNATGSIVLENCLIRDNLAGTSNPGGGLWSGAGTVRIANCTIERNEAQTGGGLAFGNAGSAVIDNTIVRNSVGGEIDPGTISVIVRYSNVAGGAVGAGNIDAAVTYVDFIGGDFRLAAGSAGIDAADGDAAPLRDLDGNRRVDDPLTADTGAGQPPFADMGAYEYQP